MKKINIKKIILQLKHALKVFLGINIYFYLKKNYFLLFKTRLNLNKNLIYYIHIGKTGGTLLKSIFLNKKNNIYSLSEDTKLYELDTNQKYIVSIRDPISRFISAFYSRRNKSEIYSKQFFSIEAIGFYLYKNANNLAEDLYSKNILKTILSHISMRCIPTLNENIFYWFDIQDLKKNPPSFIFENSSFIEDWKIFSEKFGFHKQEIFNNVDKENRTIGKEEYLSEKAKENLKRYYKKDIKIYNYCLKLKKSLEFLNLRLCCC